MKNLEKELYKLWKGLGKRPRKMSWKRLEKGLWKNWKKTGNDLEDLEIGLGMTWKRDLENTLKNLETLGKVLWKTLKRTWTNFRKDLQKDLKKSLGKTLRKLGKRLERT